MTSKDKLLDIFDHSTGVSIDTRTLRQGELFFALKGENFDGNKFVNQALDKGAIAVVASDPQYETQDRVVVVKDTLEALQNLAQTHRQRFNLPVIGITGTNGKTTTKELLCAILNMKYEMLCTHGNLNNHIGVPLNVLRINDNHDMAVIEMGASAQGEIEFLCNIAKPTHALITSVGKAHIEGFGSYENIIKTKTELYRYVKEHDGYFFYNNEILDIKDEINDFEGLYSFDANDFKGKNIKNIKLNNAYPFLQLQIIDYNNKALNINTKLYGEYNFINIVNAVKIADFFDVDLMQIKDALEKYMPQNNRSQIIEKNGNTVILDAYNANPGSMMKAIQAFEKIKTDLSKIMILGDMLEMGAESEAVHRDIIEYIKEHIDAYEKVYFVGKEFMNIRDKHNIISNKFTFVLSQNDIKDEINAPSFNGKMLLLKGSRGIGLEKMFRQ